MEDLTEEQRDAYNQKIKADNEYAKSMSENGPIGLFILGLVVGFFGILDAVLGALGEFFCILAVLWMIIRVIDRAHRYQRVKDADAEYRRLMNQK
jgi:hypothetical protein